VRHYLCEARRKSSSASSGGGDGASGGGGGGEGGAGAVDPSAAAATGTKRPHADEQAEDSRDAELRELRAKLRAFEAAARQAAAAAEAAAHQAAAAAEAAARQIAADAKAAEAKKAAEKATCVICADIWELPVTAPGCGHVCCKACLMDCASRKNECPQCLKPLVAEQPHAATAEFPTFASQAVFDWPVSVPLRELADEARAKEDRGSAAKRSVTAAARLLRLAPCRAPSTAPLDLRVLSLTCEITALADARLADSRGRSLLWWSCHKGLGMTMRLVAAGADVNAADTHFKRTPLMGCMGFLKGQDFIKALLAKGADVHAVSADGKTALDVLEPFLGPANADCREYLLMLAEADVFKGEAPPAKLLPYIGLAVSERAHQ
jgi:hypothetical protein